MTAKKAIEILDWIISNKTKAKKEFYEPEILSAKYETSATLCRTLLTMTETDIHNLESVKEQLVPNCNHPKEMHDICEGQKYCMGCNMDL